MTRKVVTCRAEDDLQVALDAMSAHQLRRIPVVDDNDQILGIIAQADVATRIDQPEKVAELVKDISQSKIKSSIGPVNEMAGSQEILPETNNHYDRPSPDRCTCHRSNTGNHGRIIT